MNKETACKIYLNKNEMEKMVAIISYALAGLMKAEAELQSDGRWVIWLE